MKIISNCLKWFRNHSEIERLKTELAGCVKHGRRTCVAIGIPEGSSVGTVRAAVRELKRAACRKFPVTDDERQGTCYAFHGFFDVLWEDGSADLGIVDLSYRGIRKVDSVRPLTPAEEKS